MVAEAAHGLDEDEVVAAGHAVGEERAHRRRVEHRPVGAHLAAARPAEQDALDFRRQVTFEHLEESRFPRYIRLANDK